MDRIEDLETGKKRLQIELDDLVSTRGTADKNVHELEKAKRALESQLTEQKTQVSFIISLYNLEEMAKIVWQRDGSSHKYIPKCRVSLNRKST